MACDLTSGRLLDDCLVGRAGLKTLFFINLNDWLSNNITIVAGEVTIVTGGTALTAYRFELADNVGNWEQAVTGSNENGTSFVEQTLLLTLFAIKPADLADLDSLKRGRWVCIALDFQDEMRVFGIKNGVTAIGGSDMSGTAAGDKKGLDLNFSAQENDYAVFMDAFTTYPFDNFVTITPSPAYPV